MVNDGADQRASGRVGPYYWEEEQGSLYVIRRDDHDHASRTTSDPQSYCQDLYQQEKEGLAALHADDPLALCRMGWHQHEFDGSSRAFFRFMSGVVGQRLNYWIGSSPIRWDCARIAGIGPQATPWTCAVCGEQVPNQAEA